MAFEPQKLMDITRDLVFNHFGNGDESRWIIILLANVGSRIGSVDLMEARPDRMLCMLQNAVRRRLGAVKSRPHSKRVELVGALDCTLETMVIHCSVSPFSEVNILRQEAAPIFRQLCPEPPNVPINLPSLLQNPLGSLRHYAEIETIFCVLTDMPTIFRYEVTTSGSQPSCSYQSVPVSQNDGIVQWLHGVPNEIILLFAKMTTMRQDVSAPNEEAMELLERDIREIQPFDGPSTERFVTIMRSVVQECWRQAAFVYLYMAVKGDPCDTPRVKEAYKRFMRLLKGTKPGRLPDEFLIAPLLIISPAAQQQHDREIIRQRALGLQRPGQTFRSNVHIICIVEDYWARADAEGRPVMWSDVAVSRNRMLGV
ncbi:fungal-specific transcription factor domain-containing protein [Rhizoctonia solani]|nr:fungal-specific transcription factor domain-containing protein [Rhizoctonia solani]